MRNKLNFSLARDNWPLLINLGILWITVLFIYFLSIEMNHSHFGYILDDAYIHMAMAKHFAQEGIWGITPYSFSSSTSSILWVLLLSLSNYMFGVREITPLILNILFSTATLILVYHIFRKCNFPPWYNFIILLLITLATPLPTLIFTGMEHSMQIFMVIAFVYLSTKILSPSKDKSNFNNDKLNFLSIVILGVLLVLTRYESLFLIGIISVLLLLRKKISYGISLFMLSILPIMIYGFISTSQGWLFLPNSLMIKSFLFNTGTFEISLLTIYRLLDLLKSNLENMSLVFLILSSLILLIKNMKNKSNFWDSKNILLIIFLTTLFVNLFTLSPNVSINTVFFWAFRYDAYIIALGIFVLAIALKEYMPTSLSFPSPTLIFNKKMIPKYLVILILIILLISAFDFRGYSMANTPQATDNIYEQQYQMGLFLKEYYTGSSVAVSDIGAVNFLADIKCLDLLALGSMETIPLNKYGFNNDTVQKLTKEKNIKIVIIYDRVFEDCIPNSWIKVGAWEIKNNKVCSDKVVSFYATNPDEASKLMMNLRNFSSRLPPDVIQREYLNN